MKKLLKILGVLVGIILLLGIGFLYWYFRPDFKDVDENHLPQFIQADFIDLANIYTISKFRSGIGHDFSGEGTGEKCRSMKHYFEPQGGPEGKDISQFFHQPDPSTSLNVYSPVDGRIMGMKEENTPIGKQIRIQPTAHSSYAIRLFHVFPTEDIKMFSTVKAGQKIGVIGKDQGMDVAVEHVVLGSARFVSYFQIMPDFIFANYQKRGVTSREEFIFTKEQRDLDPLKCNGEQFAQNYQQDPTFTAKNEVRLSGYQEPPRQNGR